MAFPVTEVKLSQNTITQALFNMIISQQVFDSGVASTELADRFRVDGTLFGDTKLYHSFDIGSPEDCLLLWVFIKLSILQLTSIFLNKLL